MAAAWMYPLAFIAMIGIMIYLLYSQGIATSKSIAATLFIFWPGKSSDQATVDSCSGWIRHRGRFYESRIYEFVLYTQMSHGDVEVDLLDEEMQPLLKLTPWSSNGRIALDGKSRYYLQWEFSNAAGRCELRW